ncbi:MAG: hypothetical protein H6908_03120 [Hyphomicrobiales bacterium]|nr:hypothetical protein [Hyphomicrobiales bacterium]
MSDNEESPSEKKRLFLLKRKKRDMIALYAKKHREMAEDLPKSKGGVSKPEDTTVELNPMEHLRSMRSRVREQRAKAQMKWKSRGR